MHEMRDHGTEMHGIKDAWNEDEKLEAFIANAD